MWQTRHEGALGLGICFISSCTHDHRESLLHHTESLFIIVSSGPLRLGAGPGAGDLGSLVVIPIHRSWVGGHGY